MAFTILIYFLMESPMAAIVTRPSKASTPVALAAAALIALAVVWSEVLVPRQIIPRLRLKVSDDEIALIRWAYAGLPLVIGIGAVALRGQSWAFVLGFLVSAALTIQMARAFHQTSRAELAE